VRAVYPHTRELAESADSQGTVLPRKRSAAGYAMTATGRGAMNPRRSRSG
jgi:hypothetical protein